MVDFKRVLSFFIENYWLKLFHKLTTDVIGNSENKLKIQFAIESRNYNKSCLFQPTPVERVRANSKTQHVNSQSANVLLLPNQKIPNAEDNRVGGQGHRGKR